METTKETETIPEEKEKEKEKEEVEEDLADHLLLVVHGIGNHEQKWKEIIPKLQQNKTALLPQLKKKKKKDFRLEIIPVDWHKELHTKTDDLVEAVTLKNMTLLRTFVSKTALDAFYFMSPLYSTVMYKEVASQLNASVKQFKEKHPAFSGKVSILGHSLGSCICYDLLSNQEMEDVPRGGNVEHWKLYSETKRKGEKTLKKTTSLLPQLEFSVENFFAIGSPMSLFLTIRGDTESDMKFPNCRNVFNILHPYDLIAYRFEPWIDSQFAETEPKTIKYFGNPTGARVSLLHKLSSTSAKPVTEQEDKVAKALDGVRFDYSIQLGMSDPRNWAAYASAAPAHRSYWGNKDIMLFILEQSSGDIQ